MVVPEFDCHHPEEGLGGTNARLALMELAALCQQSTFSSWTDISKTLQLFIIFSSKQKNTSNIEVFENKSLLLKSNII